MSILIKKIEMPKGCWACPFAVGKYYECLFTKKSYNWGLTTRPSDCPLVEVPTPHGRLGDLDKLWDRMYNYIDNEGAKMPFGDNDFMIHRDSACELVEDAHTIIEAEGRDT